MGHQLINPVILCGGLGSRLWPLSRAAKPKPFLPLVENRTLFEATLARCSDREVFGAPIIVAGETHVGHIEMQLADETEAQLIVEPVRRNTAAAIALAALRLPEDGIMLVCPSDHHIANTEAFRATAKAAAQLAADGWLVSFGIEASAPEIGFGYLQRGAPIGEIGFRTARFVEKPDLASAQEFIADGGYVWNGGIFAFRAGVFLAELDMHRPKLAAAARAAVIAGDTAHGRFHPNAALFASIDGESVDYAVMENTRHAALVPVEMGWSDIGNWDAVLEARPRDDHGNAVFGAAELVDCRNVLVETDGPRVSALGLENVVVVVNGDEVMVTTREGAQLIGKLSGAASQ